MANEQMCKAVGWWLLSRFAKMQDVQRRKVDHGWGVSIYIYIWSPPPPRAYLCPLLVEGVNSTLCASFLQMPENTVKYSVLVGCLPSM